MNNYKELYNKLIESAQLIDRGNVLKSTMLSSDGIYVSFGVVDGVAVGNSSLFISYETLDTVTSEEISAMYQILMDNDRIKREQSTCKLCGHSKFNHYKTCL